MALNVSTWLPWPPQSTWPVVLAALFIRAAPIPLIMRFAPGIQQAGFASDGTDYYSPLAHNLATYHEFALTPGHPTAAYVPLYPLLLALLEVVHLSGPLALITLQAVVGALGLVLVFVWVRQIAGATPALLALGLAALLPDFAVYSYLNMSENPFMVLMLATLIVCPVSSGNGGFGKWIVAGLFLGMAALTREFGATLLLPLAGAAWWNFGLRHAAPRVAGMVLAACLIILPWTVRNYRLSGELIPLTDKGAVNVYISTLKGHQHLSDPRRNWTLEDPAQEAVDRELRKDLAVARNPAERRRLYLRAAWSNLVADPGGQLLYLGRKIGFFWQPNVGMRHGERIGHPIVAGAAEAAYWLCLLAAVSGAFVRRTPARRLVLPGLLTAWTFLFHLFVGEAESRYHFVLLPAVFVFAGISLAAVLHTYKPAGPQDQVPLSTG